MKILDLSFLPFMGAASSEDQGYIFVPDGCGAIINFNSGKKSITPYSKKVYGVDNTLQSRQLAEGDDGAQIYLPVFGVRRNQEAMVAVIENGDGVATIHADVSGKINDYNYVYSSYTLIESGLETNMLLNKGAAVLRQEQPLTSDIQIRYLFTDKNGGTYTDMATTYREYLLDIGKLQKQVQNDDAVPFAVNLIGAVSYKTTKMGIPVEAEKPLTTFDQAQSILKQLDEALIPNIVLSYSGWMNGGLHSAAPFKIDPVRSLGGDSGFKNLIAYTQGKNIDLYPEANFTYVKGTGNGFRKNADTARDLSELIAKNYTFNMATGRRNQELFQFIVSPLVLGRMSDSFLEAYQNYKVNGVSLPLLSSHLNGDYTSEVAGDRQVALNKVVEAMTSINDNGYQLMVSGANAYALSKASFVTNVPSDSGNHYLFDESVPFYQTVLHGILPYSGTPLNMSDDFQTATLKCIEYGAAPYFEWIYEDNIELKETDFDIFNVNYSLWLEEAVTAYGDINRALSKCRDAIIVSHSSVGEQLYETVYDNGCRIYVNYGDQSAQVDGNVIEAKSYTVVEGGAG